MALGTVPVDLGTVPEDLAEGAVDGRGPGRPAVKEVVRESVGRETPFDSMEVEEGGREKLGRVDDVPLKDWREEAREGGACEDGVRTVIAQVSIQRFYAQISRRATHT